MNNKTPHIPVAFLEDWERFMAETYQGYSIDHLVLPWYRRVREGLPWMYEALTDAAISAEMPGAEAWVLETCVESALYNEALAAIDALIAEGYSGLVRDWSLPGEDRRVAILEWLANDDRNGVYRDEDILVEFGEDAEVNTWAEAVIYLIAFAVDCVGYGGSYV